MASLVTSFYALLIIYTQIIKLRGGSGSIYQTSLIRADGPHSWQNTEDVNVILGPGVTIHRNNWLFNVTSQYGADLTIELGPKWGIHPTEISHYNIQFAGSIRSHDDAEILIVISSGNQYFAQFKSLDTASQQFQECPPSNSPLLEQNVSKIINSATPDRYDRYCNNSDWNDQGFDESTVFPMQFFFFSNPSDNTLNYSWFNDFTMTDEIPEFSSNYTTTFPSEQGFKIYISGDKLGHSFIISRIALWYQTHLVDDGLPTMNPTNEPTIEPTVDPTANPTSEPTGLLATITQTMDISDISSTMTSDCPSSLIFFVSFVTVFCVYIVF